MDISKVTRETFTIREGDFVFLYEKMDGELAEIVQFGYAPLNKPDIKPQFVTLRMKPVAVAIDLQGLFEDALAELLKE